MTLGLTESRRQERFDQVPGDFRPHGPAAHAQDVHVIVLDPLPGREVVVDQRRTDTLDLVGAHGRADTAAADRHAALHRARRHGPRQWDDEVRIVVVGLERVPAEVDDLVAGGAKPAGQLLLQRESAVIGRDSDTHALAPGLAHSWFWGGLPFNRYTAPVFVVPSATHSLATFWSSWKK